MRRSIILLLGSGNLASYSAGAQLPSSLLVGDSVRFRTRVLGKWTVGTVQAVGTDRLIFAHTTGSDSLSLASLRRLEVRRWHAFDARRALLGVGTGAAAGVLFAILTDGTRSFEMAVSTGLFAAAGGALGGGRERAESGAFMGGTLGALTGVIIVLATVTEDTGKDCGPSSFICLGPEESVMFGAALGGGLGGLAGSWIGALVPGQVWRKVPVTRLTAPPASGSGVRISFSMRP